MVFFCFSLLDMNLCRCLPGPCYGAYEIGNGTSEASLSSQLSTNWPLYNFVVLDFSTHFVMSRNNIDRIVNNGFV